MSEEELTCKKFRRKDPGFVSVIAKSIYGALYNLDPTTKKWMKMNIEGPVYIVKRSNAPYLRLILLNQKGNNDYEDNLDSGMKFQTDKEFIFYLKPDGDTVGVWLSDFGPNPSILNCFQNLKQLAKKFEEEFSQLLESDEEEEQSTTTSKETQKQEIRREAPSSGDLSQDLMAMLNVGNGTTPIFEDKEEEKSTSSDPRMKSANSLESDELKRKMGLLGLGGESETTSTKPSVPREETIEGVTKQELKSALLALVNDDNFVDMVFDKIKSSRR
eukprot:CAMPEP_0115009370 /NCGR_PEP_ID=MMETSP0216-20121206/22568_1 /TAXON_ID=223996 /ORGANISM="Protocruzia adherens, Strain Boccale" /LENGTH=272 /DNA_ID=CAMNT_0002377157 /DNA_START=13 /DNA_END=831 /DNA_ORIENTATION=+